MEEQFEEKATTIFLGNGGRPSQIVLLKRSPFAKLAPNTWAGIGGKFDSWKDKNQMDCALRELKEESGREGIELIEFGRVIINQKRLLSYFYGVTDYQPLPKCPEGDLAWVPLQLVRSKKFMTATSVFLQFWESMDWRVDKPFTLFADREDINDVFAPLDIWGHVNCLDG